MFQSVTSRSDLSTPLPVLFVLLFIAVLGTGSAHGWDQPPFAQDKSVEAAGVDYFFVTSTTSWSRAFMHRSLAGQNYGKQWPQKVCAHVAVRSGGRGGASTHTVLPLAATRLRRKSALTKVDSKIKQQYVPYFVPRSLEFPPPPPRSPSFPLTRTPRSARPGHRRWPYILTGLAYFIPNGVNSYNYREHPHQYRRDLC